MEMLQLRVGRVAQIRLEQKKECQKSVNDSSSTERTAMVMVSRVCTVMVVVRTKCTLCMRTESQCFTGSHAEALGLPLHVFVCARVRAPLALPHGAYSTVD